MLRWFDTLWFVCVQLAAEDTTNHLEIAAAAVTEAFLSSLPRRVSHTVQVQYKAFFVPCHIAGCTHHKGLMPMMLTSVRNDRCNAVTYEFIAIVTAALS